MASCSKDNSVMIWNMAQIKSKNPKKDAFIAHLREHENVVECVVWAPPEACSIIDHADYNKNTVAMSSLQGSYSSKEFRELQPSENDEEQKVEQNHNNEEETKNSKELSTMERLQQIKNKFKGKKEIQAKSKAGAEEEEEKKQDQQAPEELRDYLASCSRDKTIILWEVRNSRVVCTF